MGQADSPALHGREWSPGHSPCLLPADSHPPHYWRRDQVATLSSPAKPLPAGGAGKPSREREGEGKELLQLRPTPRGRSPGTCREVRVTTALFCGLDIIVNRKKASEMYWNFPVSNLLAKSLRHFSKSTRHRKHT